MAITTPATWAEACSFLSHPCFFLIHPEQLPWLSQAFEAPAPRGLGRGHPDLSAEGAATLTRGLSHSHALCACLSGAGVTRGSQGLFVPESRMGTWGLESKDVRCCPQLPTCLAPGLVSRLYLRATAGRRVRWGQLS